MLPWQMHTDVFYWSGDALDRWKAQQQANTLKLQPAPPPMPKVEMTISGPHAASVPAWRRSQVPLSQWEASERSAALLEANKLAEGLAAEKARQKLSALLRLTGKVSHSAPSPVRARWYER